MSCQPTSQTSSLLYKGCPWEKLKEGLIKSKRRSYGVWGPVTALQKSCRCHLIRAS
jgi:hypothetical protein